MKPLSATLTTAYDGGPLAVIDGLPGNGAELRPQQARALAHALLQLADDAERRKLMHRGKPLPPEHRAYEVRTSTRSEPELAGNSRLCGFSGKAGPEAAQTATDP